MSSTKQTVIKDFCEANNLQRLTSKMIKNDIDIPFLTFIFEHEKGMIFYKWAIKFGFTGSEYAELCKGLCIFGNNKASNISRNVNEYKETKDYIKQEQGSKNCSVYVHADTINDCDTHKKSDPVTLADEDVYLFKS